MEMTNSDAKDIAWPIKMPAHEIHKVDADIRNQIRSRDLVYTVTHLAAYCLSMNSNKSLGVDAEIKRTKTPLVI